MAWPRLKRFELTITVMNLFPWQSNSNVPVPESFAASVAEIEEYHASLFGKLRSMEGMEFCCQIQSINCE